ARSGLWIGWTLLAVLDSRNGRNDTPIQRSDKRQTMMVLTRGVEPPRVSPYGPEPYASAIPPREREGLLRCATSGLVQAQSTCNRWIERSVTRWVTACRARCVTAGRAEPIARRSARST